MALQQDHLWSTTDCQSRGYRSNFAEPRSRPAAQLSHTEHPRESRLSGPVRRARFGSPARRPELYDFRPSTYRRSSLLRRPNPSTDSGQNCRPPDMPPSHRTHADDQLRPWENRRHESNGERRQHNERLRPWEDGRHRLSNETRQHESTAPYLEHAAPRRREQSDRGQAFRYPAAQPSHQAGANGTSEPWEDRNHRLSRDRQQLESRLPNGRAPDERLEPWEERRLREWEDGRHRLSNETRQQESPSAYLEHAAPRRGEQSDRGQAFRHAAAQPSHQAGANGTSEPWEDRRHRLSHDRQQLESRLPNGRAPDERLEPWEETRLRAWEDRMHRLSDETRQHNSTISVEHAASCRGEQSDSGQGLRSLAQQPSSQAEPHQFSESREAMGRRLGNGREQHEFSRPSEDRRHMLNNMRRQHESMASNTDRGQSLWPLAAQPSSQAGLQMHSEFREDRRRRLENGSLTSDLRPLAVQPLSLAEADIHPEPWDERSHRLSHQRQHHESMASHEHAPGHRGEHSEGASQRLSTSRSLAPGGSPEYRAPAPSGKSWAKMTYGGDRHHRHSQTGHIENFRPGAASLQDNAGSSCTHCAAAIPSCPTLDRQAAGIRYLIINNPRLPEWASWHMMR